MQNNRKYWMTLFASIFIIIFIDFIVFLQFNEQWNLDFPKTFSLFGQVAFGIAYMFGIPLIAFTALNLFLGFLLKRKSVAIGGIIGSIMAGIVGYWVVATNFGPLAEPTFIFLSFLTGCTQDCWGFIFLYPPLYLLIGSLIGAVIGYITGRIFRKTKYPVQD